ncbi:hypothetical protein UFOVP257_175 [uncultured Caudovirales phage]|uniref:Uncharacterized protein n=1 Tax=uncultured Caudovirales phage TaxID=2100421 RepID=A0A6J5LJA3_9CAUD|nr:hypothetical protein UFOVP257_175 [uncultured Caudovirales phage]
MYIEFRLPTGAGGMAAGHAYSLIKQDIEEWAQQYNVPHKTKIHKYTYRLCLENDSDYNFFALTWNPKSSASKNFSIKNPQ